MAGRDVHISVEVRDSIEAEFLSVRCVDVEGLRIRRLLVTTESADQFPVLAIPEFGPAYDLKTGARYRLSGLLLCQTGVERQIQGDLTDRTVFNSSSQQSAHAVLQSVRRLGLEGRFGVYDLKTTIQSV